MKLIYLFFIAFAITISPNKISTSYTDIVNNLSKNKNYTVVYLWKPWCKPCVDNMKYLSRLNKTGDINVILLTTTNEKVDLASKYGFETCYFFNSQIYKTHTREFDEYDQFNKEVFTSQKIKQPLERGICPADFLFDKNGKLLHYNNGLETNIDSVAVNRIINSSKL